MSDINKRVGDLIEATSNSKASFSQRTGISTVILSHISSGRNKVSLTAVQQILDAFPKVSADWIIQGTGAMFKDGLENDIVNEIELRIEAITSEMDRYKRSMDLKIGELNNAINQLKT